MAFNLLDADRVWKYDLHVHTREVSPCGRMTIEEMGEAYERAGYDGIWLTNHLHRDFLEATAGMGWQERAETFLAPYRKAKRWERRLSVGLGVELRFLSDANDYLLYGVTEEMIFGEAERWVSMNLREFYGEYRDRLLIIQAHPNRAGESSPADFHLLHGYEAVNSSPRHHNQNGLTQRSLCLHPWLIPTAGSDSHRPEDVGRTGILTDRPLAGNEDLTALLKSREYELIPYGEEGEGR